MVAANYLSAYYYLTYESTDVKDENVPCELKDITKNTNQEFNFNFVLNGDQVKEFDLAQRIKYALLFWNDPKKLWNENHIEHSILDRLSGELEQLKIGWKKPDVVSRQPNPQKPKDRSPQRDVEVTQYTIEAPKNITDMSYKWILTRKNIPFFGQINEMIKYYSNQKNDCESRMEKMREETGKLKAQITQLKDQISRMKRPGK